MTLLEKIEIDLRNALKAKDEVKKGTLRMLKADLMTEKAKTGKDITEEQALEVITRAAKRRKEAAEEFKKAGRDDLAKKELDELIFIEDYLPKQLTEDEIMSAINAKIASVGTVTQKEMGKVMGELMKELKGRADGNIVRSLLQKKIEG